MARAQKERRREKMDGAFMKVIELKKAKRAKTRAEAR